MRTLGLVFVVLIALAVHNPVRSESVSFFVDGGIFLVPIALEVTDGYDRDDWPHWNAKVGGGCFSVRDKVLAEESLVPVIIVPASGGRCRVIQGLWNDPYTRGQFTNSASLQIDHLVPLFEAHRSGGHGWTVERRRAFANDLDFLHHLIAVKGSENGSKGDKDPKDYLPPNHAFRCTYVKAWLKVKSKWGLAMDQPEADAVVTALGNC